MSKQGYDMRKLLAKCCISILAGVFASASLPLSQTFAASCRHYTAHTTSRGPRYRFSTIHTVPNNSSCQDINVTTFVASDINSVGLFRVRFYPASGGNYVNAWRFLRTSRNPKPIATHVKNGTKYRVESIDDVGNVTYDVIIYD